MSITPQPSGRRVNRQEIDRTSARVDGLRFDPSDFRLVDNGTSGAVVMLNKRRAPPRAAFEVYRTGAGTIAVKGGYVQSQTNALTSYADKTGITVAANLEVFAEYDLGLDVSNLPQWKLVSSHVVQTAASLPSSGGRWVVVPIASVTFANGVVQTITQHHTGNLLCPDMIAAGTVDHFNGTTMPYGWRALTDAEARVIVGYKSGDADYGTIGNTGGVNSHTLNLSHKHTLRGQSSGPGPAATSTSCYHFDTAETACSDNAAEWCSDSINDTTGALTLDNRMKWYVLTHKIHL